MRSSEIEALLERVRGLKGPDREVDEALAAMVADATLEVQFNGHRAYHRGGFWISIGEGGLIPPYTASLDAVVGLIERELPNYWWGVHQPQDLFRGYVCKHSPLRPMPFTVDAATPALSLCAAFLAAKLAMIKETEDADAQ